MMSQEEWETALAAIRKTFGRPDPVRFDRFYAAFPGALYISTDDTLHLRTFNADGFAGALRVRARLLQPNGEVTPNEFHVAVAGFTQDIDFQLGEGFLLSVAVEAPGVTLPQGRWFVTVGIVHGSGASQVWVHSLIADYLTTTRVLGWPYVGAVNPPDHAGRVAAASIADPAAGAEAVVTVPDHQRWRLTCGAFTLTTDATVPVRTVTLVIDDGLNIVWNIEPNAQQAASLVRVYEVGFAGVSHFGASTHLGLALPPSPVLLLEGWRIRTVTTGLAAGDQFSAVAYAIERWVED